MRLHAQQMPDCMWWVVYDCKAMCKRKHVVWVDDEIHSIGVYVLPLSSDLTERVERCPKVVFNFVLRIAYINVNDLDVIIDAHQFVLSVKMLGLEKELT